MRSPVDSIRLDCGVNRLSVSHDDRGLLAVPLDNRHIKLYDLTGSRVANLPRRNRQVSGRGEREGRGREGGRRKRGRGGCGWGRGKGWREGMKVEGERGRDGAACKYFKLLSLSLCMDPGSSAHGVLCGLVT